MTYTRKCPGCGIELVHNSKYYRNSAEKKGRLCKSCCVAGSNNPMYGKTHTQQARAKMAAADKSYTQTPEFRQKISDSTSGEKNPMFGVTVKDIWIDKYGKKEAAERERMRAAKLSKANTGSNNPMYGKPSPNGSGNGWKGWYRKTFFRSLRELMYILYLYDNDIEWVNGETLRLPYKDYNGKDRTYSPDFIHSGLLIEVKPKKLQQSKTNQAKRKAALAYCAKAGLEHQYVDPEIDCYRIKQELDNGYIVFHGNYLTKFEEYYDKEIGTNKRASR